MFLGRTLLLRLQGYQTCVGAGIAGSRVSKRCGGAAAFGARGCLPDLILYISVAYSEEAFVLRTDAAFAAPVGGYQTCVGAGMLAPGLANAMLAQHLVLGDVWDRTLIVHFGGLLRKAFVLRTDAAFGSLQSYQTCGGAGMLGPGLANAVVVQHLVLGDVCGPYCCHFGGLLEEAFVLRTDAACCSLQGYQTCFAAGMVAPGLANAVLVQHLRARRCLPSLLLPFRWRIKKAFVLRTDVAFGSFQGYQTCVGSGMVAPGLANAVLVQHFVLGDVCGPYFADFCGLLEETCAS